MKNIIVYIDGFPFLRKDEHYPEWDAYIQSIGIKIKPDGTYSGNMPNFMDALLITEDIIRKREAKKKQKKNESLFHFKGKRYKNIFPHSVNDFLWDLICEHVACLPLRLYNCCKDKLWTAACYSTEGHMRCYRIKDNETIVIHAETPNKKPFMI